MIKVKPDLARLTSIEMETTSSENVGKVFHATSEFGDEK